MSGVSSLPSPLSLASLSLSSPTLSLPQHSKWESLALSRWGARQPQYWPWMASVFCRVSTAFWQGLGARWSHYFKAREDN